jgi:hypothetical protein
MLRMDGRPLWQRWVAAFLLFAGIFGGGALIIHDINSSDSAQSSSQSAVALVQADQVGAAAVAADQAPMHGVVPRHDPPARALAASIAGDLRRQVARSVLGGPVGQVSCTRSGGSRERMRFRCTGLAGGISYPFDAVLAGGRTLTWCKVDAPPVTSPGLYVPVSAACR